MSREYEIDRVVRTWLQDGATVLPDRVLDDVLGRLPQTRQRRRTTTWPNPGGNVVSETSRLLLTTAAAVALFVAAVALLPAVVPSPGGPAATALATSSPTTNPTTTPASPSPVAAEARGALEPGVHHVLTVRPADVELTVPAGWHLFVDSPGFTALTSGGTSGLFRAVAFWTVSDVVADPCDHTLQEAVGPTVDDLVAALRQIPSTSATTPVQTTLGGRPATTFRLAVDTTLPCPASTFFLWPGRYAQGPGEQDDMWVLDVDGQRLVVLAEWLPGITDAERAELQAMIDSIRITSAGGG